MKHGDKYILNGHRPISEPDLMKWARWFETADRHVARTMIGDVRVSTVFLGLDHSFDPKGPPLLFETMVFGGPLDGEQDRYSTWQEAEKGHAAIVKRAKEAQS
jgi:hypothetical protein